MINVAFYDEKRRKLINHEKLDCDRSQAGLAAIDLGLMYQSGNHQIPSRCWVVWNKPDDVGVFLLDQVGSDLNPVFSAPPPNSVFDHINSCVAKLHK